MLKTTSSAQQNARMYRNISEYTECAKHARMYRMFIAVYRNIYIYIYEYVGIYWDTVPHGVQMCALDGHTDTQAPMGIARS